MRLLRILPAIHLAAPDPAPGAIELQPVPEPGMTARARSGAALPWALRPHYDTGV